MNKKLLLIKLTKLMCNISLKILSIVVKEAERIKMTDEQFYIEFEFKVNELSVRDHNNPG